MKGRFRKGKKAYRMAVRSPRQSTFERRYQRWLIQTERQKKASIHLAQAALLVGSGAMAIALIRSKPDETAQMRALAIAQQVIDTAHAISKVFSQPI